MKEVAKMWLKIQIDCAYIKRETEKAYQLVCPYRSRYEGYRFWIPKNWVQIIRQGGFEYAQVMLRNPMMIEIKYFVSKRRPPIVKQVSSIELVDCFRMEQERIMIRRQHIWQNQQADYLFEKEMRHKGF